jgi:hypothetical protein
MKNGIYGMANIFCWIFLAATTWRVALSIIMTYEIKIIKAKIMQFEIIKKRKRNT